MPTLPASRSTHLPESVDPDDAVWAETLGAGAYTSHRLPRGSRLRLTDTGGEACAGVLLHNACDTTERLNVADTVKVQWQAYLGQGSLLLSDRGRAMATLIADTAGGHDALCGCTTPGSVVPFDPGDLERPFHSGRELFGLALAQHDLTRRDAPSNVNFFRHVTVGADGGLHLVPAAVPSVYVELRCEMDVIVSIVNVPHPLDDRNPCPCTPVELVAWRDDPAGPDDRWWQSSPESRRAFENTDDYLKGLG